jgi:predicted O-methyltransferase YrrM
MESTTATRLGVERIPDLYRAFARDLVRVRRYQSLLFTERFDQERAIRQAEALVELANSTFVPIHAHSFTSAQFDDLEAEIAYLLMREHRPELVVEVSPCGGWSTSWILNALHDNAHGVVHSYDLIDHSLAKVPPDLRQGRHWFHQGDVRESRELPSRIDYLFLDSDHTGEFGGWAVANLFPRVRSGGLVSVHDVFHPDGVAISGGEGPVVLDWLERNGIDYLSLSPTHAPEAAAVAEAARREIGITFDICESRANSALFFVMP